MTRVGLGIAVGLLLAGTPTAASAQLQGTPEQRAACMGDALMLCMAVLPNRARIASCLGSHMDELSPGCRAQFEKYNAARGTRNTRK